ncbi:MAG: hypothetical protein WCJ63_01160 [Actinomycetes bacterium]
MSSQSVRSAPALLAMASLGLASFVAAGCGGATDSNNGFRPPVTRVIGLSVDPKTAVMSPTTIGAGPAELKIANKTRVPLIRVSLHSYAGAGGCVSAEAVAGPIPAGGTGTLKATLVEGTCEIIADGRTTSHLEVTAERPSAQNDLLLP